MEKTEFLLTVFIYMIAYVIEPLLLFYTYNKFLHPIFSKKRFYVGCFIGYYLIILAKQVFILCTDSNLTAFFFLIMFSYTVIINKFFYLGKVKQKIGIYFSMYIFCAITDVLATLIFLYCKIPMQEIFTFSLKSSIINLIIALTKVPLYFLFVYLGRKVIEKREIFNLIFLYLLSIVTLFIAMFYFDVNLTKPSNVVACFYCLEIGFTVSFIVYLVLLFRNKTAKEKAAIQRAEMSESKLALYQYTKETYEEIKSIRHDLKRHYNYLRELARQNNVHEIECYLDELCSDLKRTEDLYVCDNLVLAVALYDKEQTAKEQTITFSKSITANTFPFTDSELNSILTNILDNAFEAVEKVTESERKVLFVVKEINQSELMIHCENTYNKEAYNNLSFLSTGKDDKVNHRYGTKIVKSIVQRYHGTVTYWKDDMNFYVRVIVPST